jgi:UDP-N-acetylmuramyl tripeptide synthase
VLTEKGALDGAELPVPVVRVPSVRALLGRAASAVYGHPSFSVELIGVTGTNGKTTTTHLVRDLLDDLEGRAACGIVGTVGNVLGPLSWAATHTTPEADEAARLLAAMRDSGAQYVSMEVSSIALARTGPRRPRSSTSTRRARRSSRLTASLGESSRHRSRSRPCAWRASRARAASRRTSLPRA